MIHFSQVVQVFRLKKKQPVMWQCYRLLSVVFMKDRQGAKVYVPARYGMKQRFSTKKKMLAIRGTFSSYSMFLPWLSSTGSNEIRAIRRRSGCSGSRSAGEDRQSVVYAEWGVRVVYLFSSSQRTRGRPRCREQTDRGGVGQTERFTRTGEWRSLERQVIVMEIIVWQRWN